MNQFLNENGRFYAKNGIKTLESSTVNIQTSRVSKKVTIINLKAYQDTSFLLFFLKIKADPPLFS